MAAKKKILIAAHTFPPYPGIGGRRWAKFAKFLSRAGHDVIALSAELGQDQTSNWTRDVVDVKHETYAHKFPAVLSSQPSTVFNKLQYRSALRKMKAMSKGTPYDRALQDERAFKAKLTQLVRNEKPDVLVVTGAPFLLLAFAADLRSDFPELSFVADFRDPWTWGAAYGYQSLPEKRLKHEQYLEKYVCQKFDLVLSPWPQIIEKLKSSYPDEAGKMRLLSHGFDPDDINQGQVPFQDSQSAQTLLYGGTIYEGFTAQLRALSAALSKAKSEAELHVYCSDRQKLTGLAEVEIHDSLPAAQFFQKAREADWLLFPIPAHLKDGVPTKLYEYAALKKPILAFGYKGRVSDFIEENGMGIFLSDLADIPEVISRPFAVKTNNDVIKAFSLEKISADFVQQVDQLN